MGDGKEDAMTDTRTERKLTPEQHHVMRDHGTERPGSSPLNHEKRPGEFRCAGCGAELFDARHKFESGTGWPSFWDTKPGAVKTTVDSSHGMVRTEFHCAQCGGHLGHIFNDGPVPTGLRYCTNGCALDFKPDSK
jgi:peptide-methionine (R)-S-oxide reductase